jgi:hypothetical protein
MKSRFLNSMLATVAVVIGLGVSTAQAQDAKLIDLRAPIIQAQQTPDIKADKEKSRILTTEVNHVNVPVGEGMASVVYLSPSAVLGLSGSPRVQTNAVTLWAVEVTHEGKTVGFISSKGKSPTDPGAEWWKATSAPPTVAGVLKNKMETPFAPLWGDYHAEVQSNK